MHTSAVGTVDATETAGRWRSVRLAAAVAAAVALLVTLLPVAVAQAATACNADTGPRQTRLEKFLGLVPDGTNSESDCRAIRKFQRKNGIEPAEGYAGTVTGKLVKRLRLSADRADKCDARAKVVCVDLKSQTAWIAEEGHDHVGAVRDPQRTGRVRDAHGPVPRVHQGHRPRVEHLRQPDALRDVLLGRYRVPHE